MKKSLILTALIGCTLGAMAIGYFKYDLPSPALQLTPSDSEKTETPQPLKFLDEMHEEELFFELSNRFLNTISKKDLHNAKTIFDVFPKEATLGIDSFTTNKVGIMHKHSETSEKGMGTELNKAQLNLLKTTNYGTNFHLVANYGKGDYEKSNGLGEHVVYYMTVVPEQQAEYLLGKEAFIDYIRSNSKRKAPKVKLEDFDSGKISFLISKQGKMTNIQLESSCGYKGFDQHLLELVKSTPGNWKPATNELGEPIEQLLSFSFGNLGC